jgi:hypothetical protein
MPYGDPDPSDPTVLVGVALPADLESVREMAWVFAEEFARMGFGARRIEALFRSPFYGGAHHAWRVLGEAEVEAIVAECAAAWGRPREGE